jgi:hypothetical protein
MMSSMFMDMMLLFLNCARFEDEPTSVCYCGDDDAITCDEAEATESDVRVGRAHAATRVCGEHVERKQGEIQVAQE